METSKIAASGFQPTGPVSQRPFPISRWPHRSAVARCSAGSLFGPQRLVARGDQLSAGVLRVDVEVPSTS